MAKGYSARGGFSGGGSAMRQQQMQQKLLKMQQDMAAAPLRWAAVWCRPPCPARRS